MNKYVAILIAALVVLGGGFYYKTFVASESSKPLDTGVLREFTITAEKNAWNFNPAVIEVNQGDHVVLTVVNQDDYDHGLAIDAFGISKRIFANTTEKIDFVATQPGEFPYYCSVSCGSGIVDGKTRGHFDQTGKLIIKAPVTSVE